MKKHTHTLRQNNKLYSRRTKWQRRMWEKDGRRRAGVVAREPKERVGVWDAKMNFCVVHRAEWITKRTNDQKKNEPRRKKSARGADECTFFSLFLAPLPFVCFYRKQKRGKEKRSKETEERKKKHAKRQRWGQRRHGALVILWMCLVIRVLQ